jgi:hypothetical protein
LQVRVNIAPSSSPLVIEAKYRVHLLFSEGVIELLDPLRELVPERVVFLKVGVNFKKFY